MSQTNTRSARIGAMCAACVGFALALCASHGAAQACACCDAEDDRTVLGWDAKGARLAVRRWDATGCRSVIAVEVWEVGGGRPVACYDPLSKTPTRPVACNAVTDQNMLDVPHRDVPAGRALLKAVGLLDTFKVRPKRAPKRTYRVRETSMKRPDEPPRPHLTVSLRDGKRFRKVISVEASLKPYVGHGVSLRPRVEVWRVPKAPRTFAIVWSAFDPYDREYWLRTRIMWVDLDANETAPPIEVYPTPPTLEP